MPKTMAASPEEDVQKGMSKKPEAGTKTEGKGPLGNRKILLAVAVVVIASAVVAAVLLLSPAPETPRADNGDYTTKPPTGTQTISVGQLVTKMGDAAASIDTGTLDFSAYIAIDMQGGYLDSLGGGKITIDMTGDIKFDYKNKRGFVDMTLDSPFLAFYGGSEQNVKMYIIGDTLYLLMQDPETGGDQWIRQQTNEDFWADAEITAKLVELMGLVEAKVVGEENLMGKRVYVVEMKPDVRAALEYLLKSQLTAYPDYEELEEQLDEQIELIQQSIKSASLKVWVGVVDSLLYKLEGDVAMEVADETGTTGAE
ncbi:MAG: hypothetical protein JXB14_02040, partial [Candidatus Altiarchaeota archaeon]|nr:hypothetical protein [Candidatus Altiarchaeota archaeon]